MKRTENPGLYIHVPFCRTKCPYCDFYSTGSTPALIGAWLDAVSREADLYRDQFVAFDSIYIGGGTPSLLDAEQLAILMGSLNLSFNFSPDTEATIELNPDDATLEKAVYLRRMGFNRISVGAQSFNDRELKVLKRRHTVRQTMKALEWIRVSGFDNLGVDLIYGFDGQTDKSWLETLECALKFRPKHLSCYQMTIEEGTPFGRMVAKGKISLPGEETQRALFLMTSQFLEEHGYDHYEVSNFALVDPNGSGREPYASRHNRKYWEHVPYLGLGPAAHSFQSGSRWWNYRSTKRYCEVLGEDNKPVDASETLSAEQLRLERLYLGFRTKTGVALNDLRDPQNRLDNLHEHPDSSHADKVLSQLEESELIKVLNGRAVPTRQGFLVADSLPLLFCR